MTRRRVEDLRSGDQLKKKTHWDRVTGVQVERTVVTVTTNDNSQGTTFPKGTTVEVVL